MAIITDSIVDVGNYITFNIGLSKSLNNYTPEEVWNFPYCSSQWVYYKHIGQFENKPYMDFAPGGSNDTEGLFPLKYTGRNDLYYPQTYWFDPGKIEYNYPDGIYCRVIWLYGTNEQISNLLTGKRRSIYNTDGFKIVTQMDSTKVFIFLDNFRQEPFSNNANQNNINTLNYDNFKIKEDHDGVTSYSHPRGCSIFPAVMFYYNDKLYVHLLFQRAYESLDWSWGLNASQNTSPDHAQGWEWDAQPTSFDGTAGCYFPVNIARDFGGLRPQSVESFHTPTDMTDIGAMYQWYYYSQTGGRINPITVTAYLSLASWYGGMFYHDGKYYKPIIKDGYVTGYTDDMTVPSDIDNWVGATNHNVPPVPPGGGGGADDDIDSMGFDGMSCSVGGPAKYYIMSYNDIHHLIGDFNAHAEPGTSISNNIISCYVNALDWEWHTGSEPIEIYSGGAQTIAFTSDIKYAVLTGYNARDIIGSIDVPRMTKTFYDFSPYSTYEVYVPFCGWVALPDTVAGRHIKIYFETDEATCGCKGRVFFVDDSGNGVTVAEITGSFGAPCPIQVIEGGLYKQAMLSNGLQVIGGIASGVMGGASGSGVLAVGGLNSAMQSLGNCLIAGNTNYGQTIGRAGDASGLMCAGKPYLKITYPPIDEVVNNSIFGHTVGYLCNKIGKLSNYHGFTVCGNPHININATSTEKEEIKRLLEQGVILP